MSVIEKFQPRGYKDLIWIFDAVCSEIEGVRTFNWGELEDFDVRSSGRYNTPGSYHTYNSVPLDISSGGTFSQVPFLDTLYPYVFLNPTSIQIIQGYFQYTCNLIVVEQPTAANRDDILDSQHATLNILQDILALVRMSKWKASPRQPITTISATPIFNRPVVNRQTGTTLQYKYEVDASIDYPVNVIPFVDWGNMGVVGWQSTFTINMKSPLDNSWKNPTL
jgi:hypothetical protein